MMIAQTEFDYRIYTAHPKQKLFHQAVRSHDYTLFSAGRGTGKTSAGVIQAILEATQYQPGKRGVVVTPNYGTIEDAVIPEFLQWLPMHWIKDWNKGNYTMLLHNGSEIAFRGADRSEAKARGPNRAWAWFDEARVTRTRENFDLVIAQLRPTRKVWITTTPGGIFHWLYKLFFEQPLPRSTVISAKTSDNPYLPVDYEQTLRQQYDALFARQEIDAEWISFEGLIYDNFSANPGDNVDECAEYRADYGSIYWGCDDGYAYGGGPGTDSYHPRVVLLGQVTPVGGLHICYEYYRTGVSDYGTTIDEVFSYPYPKPEAAYVDSSAAMFIGKLIEKDIYAMGMTHKVAEGIKNLRRLICDANAMRLLKIHPRCINLIRELQSYRKNERSHAAPGGEPEPLKVDDHGADALRYLAYPLRALQ